MFRILSLDGGGIKGTASVLAAIEDEIKEPIGEYFDLIAGTSTGGILALGLGFRVPAKKIMEFYRDMGQCDGKRIEEVSILLGHSSVQVTEQRYAFLEAERIAASISGRTNVGIETAQATKKAP
jgi:hypothetical protein